MKLSEFLSLFKQGKVSAKSHIRNLYEMALVDGKYLDSEDQLLLSIAEKHNISKAKVEQIRDNKDTIEFVVPNDSNEKFEQLYELIHMMLVDSDIDSEEMKLCVVFAMRFGYNPAHAKELVDSIAGNITSGHSVQETQEQVQRLLE